LTFDDLIDIKEVKGEQDEKKKHFLIQSTRSKVIEG
jgi:hypothetical protein